MTLVMTRTDTIALPENGSAGVLRKAARVTRAGVFEYRNADGTTRRELRDPKWVFDKQSMDSLAQVPVTLLHPDEFVTDDTVDTLSVGMTGDTVRQDGQFLAVKLGIQRKDAKQAIAAGIRELSSAYSFTGLDETPGEYHGQRYDAVQVGPYLYNHVAIVPKGRAGPDVRMDGLPIDDNSGDQMKTVNIRIDGADVAVEESAAVIVTAQIARADAAQAKADEAIAKIATLETAHAAAIAQIRADALTQVKARAELETALKPHLPTDYAFDGKDDATVRMDALKNIAPDVDVTDKSADYIAARLDAAMETKRMDGYGNLLGDFKPSKSRMDAEHDAYLASVKAREARFNPAA